MTGPKIITEAAPEQPTIDTAVFRVSGIRRTNAGGWAAVKNGRLVDTFAGVGSKRAAIIAAGTNKVIG